MVQLLLAHGAQINARNAEGMSALMWAAWTSRTTVVEQLLEAGANPHLKDRVLLYHSIIHMDADKY